MSEAEEENQNLKPKEQNPQAAERQCLMDIDTDLDIWSLDQFSFYPNPVSPFLLAPSEQPCSPLWGFSDVDDDISAGNVNATFAGARCMADCPRFFTCNTDAAIENPTGNEDKKRLLPSPVGLTLSENPDGSCIIKERMTQALRYIIESTEHQHVLAQIWAPVKNRGRYVLTTLGQPFVLDPHSNGLHQYRTVSLMYMFSVDGESDGDLGLPGRVFRQKLPEWTPDVQYYSSKEYCRLNHALHYNVRGTLALPVFEPSGQSCVGVLELIMTSQKINYAPEVDKVCKALEAVNLKSSEILDHPNTQICNEGRQNALAEILEVLTAVCETHKLPLAQTWVPCRHRSILTYGGGLKKSCTRFDGSCMGQVCMSTTDVAFYVVNAHIWGFREACAEHHLQKGQGVAGRAFSSQNLCFCGDITQFSKTEYPLVHYARLFGLIGCFAICLRSSHTGDDNYILEFFLPPTIRDSKDQNDLLDSLVATIRRHFKSLKVASGKELKEEGNSIEVVKLSVDEKFDFLQISQETTKVSSRRETLPGGREMVQRLDSLDKQEVVEVDCIKINEKVAGGTHKPVSFAEKKETGKTPGKRGKAEKSISLEVLQQYFAGSLKDAAKSLGVCPTTMKRICRQHGILRWPSRKINKVNRSLTKLKRVIESVQGAEGAFTLTSVPPRPLPLAVDSISWRATLNSPNSQNSPILSTPSTLQGENNGSKTGSESREESGGTPTSHGSCQGSPTPTPATDSLVSSLNKQVNSSEKSIPPIKELNLSVPYTIPEAIATIEPQTQLGGMLVEDAGSSKDLRNLCPAVAEAFLEEGFPDSSWTPCLRSDLPRQAPPVPGKVMQHATARQEVKAVIIKASYRDDIIRFRLSLASSIVELKEEVAKRLKLEVGTFDIKYLDDDHEWVLLACDADLQECLDVSSSSGNSMVRLLVHDLTVNFGSSCESSGD